MTRINDEMVRAWRANYGLDTRSPCDAGCWWSDHSSGMAPAGAVTALGLCLQERETLLTLLREARDTLVPYMQLVAGTRVLNRPAQVVGQIGVALGTEAQPLYRGPLRVPADDPRWIPRASKRMPPAGQRVAVLMDAIRVASPHHPGHPSGKWEEECTAPAEGYTSWPCELVQTGNVTHWRELGTETRG